MRIIKFRAMRIFNGTILKDSWIYSSSIRLDYEHSRLNLGGVACEFETLGEFTGLQDKNGKDIYEDDILKDKYGNTGFCYWEPSTWNFLNHNGCVDNGNKWEVIGNIHENKELVK